MKIAIVGSRDFSDLMMVSSWVYDNFCDGDILVSGGARGVDSIAEQQARNLGIECQIMKPEYDKYPGHYAPIARNKDIAAACDKMIAFWDGKSRGTLSAIEFARELGKPVEIIYDHSNAGRMK